jgi:hypothetical protein
VSASLQSYVYLSQSVYTSMNLCVPIKCPHSGVIRRSRQPDNYDEPEQEEAEGEDADDDDGSIGAPNREGQNIHSAAEATAMPRFIKEPNLSSRPEHELRTNLGQAWTPHQPQSSQ